MNNLRAALLRLNSLNKSSCVTKLNQRIGLFGNQKEALNLSYGKRFSSSHSNYSEFTKTSLSYTLLGSGFCGIILAVNATSGTKQEKKTAPRPVAVQRVVVEEPETSEVEEVQVVQVEEIINEESQTAAQPIVIEEPSVNENQSEIVVQELSEPIPTAESEPATIQITEPLALQVVEEVTNESPVTFTETVGQSTIISEPVATTETEPSATTTELSVEIPSQEIAPSPDASTVELVETEVTSIESFVVVEESAPTSLTELSIEVPPQETVPTESSSSDVVVAPEFVELALAEPEVTSTDFFVVIEEPTATTETESK